jgi:hypothetical protein
MWNRIETDLASRKSVRLFSYFGEFRLRSEWYCRHADISWAGGFFSTIQKNKPLSKWCCPVLVESEGKTIKSVQEQRGNSNAAKIRMKIGIRAAKIR